MWTLLILVLMGIWVFITIRGRKPSGVTNTPHPNNTQPATTGSSSQLGTLAKNAGEKTWGVAQKYWQHVFTPLGLIFLLNFLLLASMKEKAGVSGSNYFNDTYLWGLTFWSLCLVIVATYIDHISKSEIKNFKIFRKASAVMFVVCVWYGVMPGFKSGGTLIPNASASTNTGAEPTLRVIDGAKRFEGHLSDRFPLSAETDSLIDAVFANHSDSVRKVMKDIAVAESGGKQFEEGTMHVVQGKENDRDLGLFQINDSLHGNTCTNAGFDITEIEGNAKCAELLLTRRGSTNDWCPSAWKWRDGYEEKPANWTCDRTPEQLLVGTDPRSMTHGDELLVVDAPADSSWSVPIFSYGRGMRWSAPPGIDIEIQTPDGTILEQLAGQHLPNFPNVRFVRFRVKAGTGAEFSPITIVRSGN